eukprot:GHVP01042774.1.p1 GENE.GHVP01042774.1~~GHVP01042774.1.p1  ORF type:complete len:101 (-),score=2.63 GHVP01042774.1:467-769(-)
MKIMLFNIKKIIEYMFKSPCKASKVHCNAKSLLRAYMHIYNDKTHQNNHLMHKNFLYFFEIFFIKPDFVQLVLKLVLSPASGEDSGSRAARSRSIRENYT